ncbi:MAG: T9SS type B sorting domain-containing protein [Bacteroidetes bacterium]|nr:T9SS type B sorting domain-containing protein [Bacteroidota bacterium]
MRLIQSLKRAVFLGLVLLAGSQARGAHLIGGELNYTCLNDSTYVIDMVIYRDCAAFGAGFDSPAFIFVYNAAGVYQTYLQLTAPTITSLPVSSGNPCLTVPPGICVEKGEYSGTFYLPPLPGGYTLVYQRCCRNATIDNLIDPAGTGSSYVETIPPVASAVCNSSPVFNNFPPILLCAGEPIFFDHSATDLDGDSLVYSLCAPFSGATSFCPAPMGPLTGGGCPPIPPSPPYAPITYLPIFTALSPLPGTPGLSIDPLSGLLTGTPDVPGQYVVGVCVQEYRAGVLLNTHTRDFQFNVAECDPLVLASIPDFILNCEDRTVIFDNSSSIGDFWFWDFGVPGLSTDTSSAYEPAPFIYPDSGVYTLMLIANPGFLCSDTAFATVGIFPALIGGWTFSAGCSGTPVVFTDTSVSTEAGEIDSWSWTFGDGSGSNEQNPVHQYEDGGSYTVTLIVGTSPGCIDTITQIVNIDPGPDAIFTVADHCQDEVALFENLSTISTGTITDWFWNFGNGESSSEESPVYPYPAAGTYWVTLIAESANGCQDSTSQELVVGYVPPADAGLNDTVELGMLYPLNGAGGGSYLWSPSTYLDDPTAEDPVFTATETTTFTVVVTSPDGCVVTDSVTIVVVFIEHCPGFLLPNAFTPDADGRNDVFRVRTFGEDELTELIVFNRWGEKVFETDDPGIGWDGTYRGKPQPLGAYLYVLRNVCRGQNFEQTGTITLLR